MSIEETYEVLKHTPSDINEHLETLKKYASECDTIVELGVRYCVSTWALLVGKPKKMVSIDIKHPNDFGGNLQEVYLAAMDENIDFQFVLGDSLKVEIPECDLLFIDTVHTYEQLSQELKKHGSKVRKYIILHDTILPEMQKAANEFEGWSTKEQFTNNNGLTILERI